MVLGVDVSPNREFDVEAMNAYAKESAFSYMDYSIQPPSIWERMGWWFQQMLMEIFGNPNTPWITEIGYYFILISVIGAAIYYIIKLRYGKVLVADYKMNKVGNTSDVVMTKTDFDKYIQEALKQQNYKLAIRYLYLKALALLDEKKLIRRREWKSTYDYELELTGNMKNSYKELAKLFEHAWYGDFEVRKEDFQEGNRVVSILEASK